MEESATVTGRGAAGGGGAADGAAGAAAVGGAGGTGAAHEGSDAAEAERGQPRKTTVLETHGYIVGETIGSGSYATVKVTPGPRGP